MTNLTKIHIHLKKINLYSIGYKNVHLIEREKIIKESIDIYEPFTKYELWQFCTTNTKIIVRNAIQAIKNCQFLSF